MKIGPRNLRGLRRYGAARAFIDSRLALGHVAFSMGDFMRETGLSLIAARRQLFRLRNMVVRVSPRQPFFLIVEPEHRSMGAPPPIWWLQDYFDWLDCPYYLALQSAASSFGSSPQALQVTQVMTDRPYRPIKLGRVVVKFFVKRHIRRTPTQQLAGAATPLCISTPEATTFDLIRYAPNIGGIERAAETITPLLPVLRARRLMRVLEAENEQTTAQRLGFVLEAGGAKRLAQTVHNWLPHNLPAVPLSPLKAERRKIPLIKRWQVFNNSSELK
jgi:AbiEi antitoxin C-terminal domain